MKDQSKTKKELILEPSRFFFFTNGIIGTAEDK